MAGETIVVQTSPQPSEPAQPSTPAPAPQQIDQAVEFGQMREAFRQTQTELAETRSVVASLQSEREAVMGELRAQREWRESQTRAVEAEAQREAEVTVIAPVVEKPKESEAPPKPKQSRLNQLLFGKEDEQ